MKLCYHISVYFLKLFNNLSEEPVNEASYYGYPLY